MGVWSVLFMSAMPVFRLLVHCGIGAYLSSPQSNVMPAEARKHINKLVFVCFMPSLIFSNLAQTVTVEKMLDWWFMPINVLLCYMIGAGIGVCIFDHFKPPPHLRKLIIACCATGNSSNLPLVLVSAICVEAGSPFGRYDVCTANGIAYISYGLWMATVLTWTVNLQGMDSFQQGYQGFQAPQMFQVPGQGYQQQAFSAMTQGPRGFQAGPRYSQGFEDYNDGFIGSQPQGFLPSAQAFPTRGRNPSIGLGDFQQFQSPQAIAIPIGAVPFFRHLLYGHQAPFRFLGDALVILGEAMIPCMNLLLGGNLSQAGFGASELALEVVISIMLTRLLLLPIAGLIVVKLAFSMGLVPADPLFHFVLLLQFTMPTAINVGTMTQLFGVGQTECSIILFWCYTSSVVFLTLWTMIFLVLLI
ncbi:hypothetical protein SELMODRAFT_117190 [Selaginella moellendorffii]|uniref:Auxin efflux carrier family protein n=1 Tax=Selaginella moellendorffii TaxID=88036 RepID=D8SHR4_SELML|nr:hypothetical protein SELMODRAFT_117190 [Selaginella moellendorffii]